MFPAWILGEHAVEERRVERHVPEQHDGGADEHLAEHERHREHRRGARRVPLRRAEEDEPSEEQHGREREPGGRAVRQLD